MTLSGVWLCAHLKNGAVSDSSNSVYQHPGVLIQPK